MDNTKIYYIKEFAEMFNLSVKTIKRYQAKEIIKLKTNPANGYRFFTDSDIEDFKNFLQNKNEM